MTFMLWNLFSPFGPGVGLSDGFRPSPLESVAGFDPINVGVGLPDGLCPSLLESFVGFDTINVGIGFLEVCSPLDSVEIR